MAAHRYWALLLTARSGSGGHVGVAEVEMRATSGGADQCTGGTAGGVNNVGRPPANAFDDNAATIWHDGATGGAPTRLSYDFGSAVTVTEIQVTNAPTTGDVYGGAYGPAACWVQWSDDGTSWQFGGPVSDLSALGDGASAVLASVTDTGPSARVVAQAYEQAVGWPTGPLRASAVGARLRFDAANGGPYRIAGTVGISGTPDTLVRRRVRLLNRMTAQLVQECWSDAATGAFLFSNLALQEYLLVSDDHTRYYNAVVADAVVPVP